MESQNTTSKTKPCQILFIRHGERADLAPEKDVKYDVKSDPPLTPLGVTQVEETGHYLKRYVEQHGFDEIVIECSPFIRTVQTAAIIAKAIGKSKVRVLYKYHEWLHPAFYDSSPMHELYLRNLGKEEIKKLFLQGYSDVEYDHDDEVGYKASTTVYPEENMDLAIERMKRVCSDLNKSYFNSQKKVLHLVATHAAIVKCFSAVHGAQIKNDWCFFCAFSGVEIHGENVKLIYDEDASHVKARL